VLVLQERVDTKKIEKRNHAQKRIPRQRKTVVYRILERVLKKKARGDRERIKKSTVLYGIKGGTGEEGTFPMKAGLTKGSLAN